MDPTVELPPPVYHDTISDGYVTFIAVASVFTALSIGCVILRFVQRVRTKQIKWDDWAILPALVFAIGLLITTILVATLGGAGYHIWTYELGQLETYIKICLANNIFYNISIMFSKASVLLFYHRIFSIERKLRRFMQVIGVVLVANCLSAVFGLIFSNSPVHGQWTLTVPSTSIDLLPFWLTMAVINLVLDVIILAIPQARVWKLQLSMQNKIAVSLVFLLGGFVCVTTTVRVVYFTRIDVQNVTYEFTVPGIWTCVEMNTSIICACLPVVYALFKPKRQGTTAASGSGFSKPSMMGTNRSYATYPKSSDEEYVRLESGSVNNQGYTANHVKVQSGNQGSDDTLPLGPIRVERAYQVS